MVESPTKVTHITRKSRVFYYRRRLPHPCVGEVSLSLRTRNCYLAEHLASCLDNKLIKLLRGAANEAEIAVLLKGYLGNLLVDYRETHWSTRVEHSIFGVPVLDGEDPHDLDLEFIQDQIGEYREAIGRRDSTYETPAFYLDRGRVRLE